MAIDIDPNVIRLEGLDLLILGLVALVVGDFILRRIPFLQKYTIPSAVIGGIVFSIILGGLRITGVLNVEFGAEMQELLMLVFFSTIGLTMKLERLRLSARPMLTLFVLASTLLIFQNMIGSAVASSIGIQPASGLLAGSISFMGGHGTGVAWAPLFIESFGIVDAEQAVLTLATLGILAGGILGGPIAEFLIRRNSLEDGPGDDTEAPNEPEKQSAWEGLRLPMMNAGIAIALSAYLAPFGSEALFDIGVTLPAFVIALLLGSVFSNLADVCRIDLSTAANTLIGDISLMVFLVISIMQIQLSYILSVGFPLIAVFVLQTVLVLAFVYSTVFSVMGRNYQSAVICAGFTGFSLGSSLIGVGNMRALTRKYGAAPVAFIIVPIVGSFLIDIFNSFIVQLYLISPILK